VKTERKPHLVRLKPKCADAYGGKLQVGREYQALFSLENAKYMSIVGTDVTHALKATGLYELPFGRGHRFGTNVGPVMDRIIGGWQVSGTTRIQSGRLFDLGNPPSL